MDKPRIIEVKGYQFIPPLMEMFKKIVDWKHDSREVARWMFINMFNSNINFLIDTKFRGFAVIGKITPILEEFIHIHLMWVDPHHPEVTKALAETIRKYAKRDKCRRVYINVKKGYEVLPKQYGFVEESRVFYAEV